MTTHARSAGSMVKIGLLSLTLLGTLAGIAYNIIIPPPDKKNLKNYSFDFPDTVPLSSWQLIKSEALPGDGEVKAMGRRYQYRHNQQELIAEIRFHRYSNGNVSRFFNIYTPIKAASVKMLGKHENGIGYYALVNEGSQAVLSACLNPIGESTITQQQFSQNRYKHGWGIKQTLLWTIGYGDLLDGRCFWTALSTPTAEDTDENTIQTKYQSLEAAWFDWYRWWEQQF